MQEQAHLMNRLRYRLAYARKRLGRARCAQLTARKRLQKLLAKAPEIC